MNTEFDRNTLLVSSDGGVLDIVSSDGELLASVGVPPGRVPAVQYLALVPEGASLQVGSGLAVMQRPSRVGIIPFGEGSHDSGANPDYRPTSASRLEREIRLTMSRMQAAEGRLEAKIASLSSIERIPHAPAPAIDPQPVIEPSEPVQEPEPSEAVEPAPL